jgi:RNA-splicing ligase RtcB
MLELHGKYANAKIFTDIVDNESMGQVSNLLNQPFVEGSQIRMMPDIHAGAGCTIGTTMTIADKICPNLVGVDIGCGMKVVELAETEVDLAKLDKVIRDNVPSGFSRRDLGDHFTLPKRFGGFRCAAELDLHVAELSLGTLGGGNHFIEVDKDDDGKLYLVVHSGSRHLGVEIATYYQHKAIEQCRGGDAQNIITALKAAGREKEIETALRTAKSSVPRELSYVSGRLFEDYLHDMALAQDYARENRYCIVGTILYEMGWDWVDGFTTVHNYIDTESMILRKGAVSAKEGERLIIPMNMRDGSLICVGKGNPDWNYSAPHGAGRAWSRSMAKEAFTMEEFERAMKGVYTTSVSRDTLDECPMAYKPMQSILDNIGDTVTVEKIIRPIYNFKASS